MINYHKDVSLLNFKNENTKYNIIDIPKRKIYMRPNIDYEVEELFLGDILNLERENNFGIALAYDKYEDNDSKYIFFSKVFESKTHITKCPIMDYNKKNLVHI
jgi:hypothetical protein